MKKRNLLSLSALVLSLGLVVTSCAGTPGAEGKPGAEGPQGPQGPQGEPGEPGKTYIDLLQETGTGKVKELLHKINLLLKQEKMKQLHLHLNQLVAKT